MSMKIKVTDLDIAVGEPGDCLGCAIALAMQRELNDDSLFVNRTTYILSDNTELPLPEEATQWMDAFDNGLLVKPFSFEVPIS